MSEYIIPTEHIPPRRRKILYDLTGRIYNNFTVIAPCYRTSKNIMVPCQCVCGNPVEVRLFALFDGSRKSCGCLTNEIIGKANRRHGNTKKENGKIVFTLTYRSWSNLCRRCLSKHKESSEKNTAKGITVCDRWREPNGQGFLNFLADMGERPSKDYSIDRIDVNGNYEPSNCRWATWKEQARNRTSNTHLTYEGKTQCVSAWAEEFRLNPNVLLSRLKSDWAIEKALNTPVRARKTKDTD